MAQQRTDTPRGVIGLKDGLAHFQLARMLPNAALEGWIEHFWVVEWTLETPYQQDTLPHPTVHVVIEAGKSAVYGVVRRKFERTLEGSGQVVGAKFRPGAFYPLAQTPVARLADRVLPLAEVFAVDVPALEAAVLNHENNDAKVTALSAWLEARLPEPDASAALAAEMVRFIETTRAVTRVEDVAEQFTTSPRSLERLFRTYVGVTPKWTIRLYRLHEALDRLDGSTPVDWRRLALELGYFDQSHFIRDFKGYLGLTPSQLDKALRGA